jgi:AcrR family transcriptional regulator
MSNKKTESLNRAVDAAAQLFSERPFDEVQIAEIAARARCSSATIYGAFETKKGLFRAALQRHSGKNWPALAQAPGPGSLANLLAYLSERISSLSTPVMQNFWRSVSTDTTHVEKVMQDSVLGTDRLAAIVDEVERCMDAGLLRRSDPSAVAYLLLAGTGYEPVVYGLLFNPDAGYNAPAIIDAVLSPLVTEQGRVELTSFVNASKSNGPPEEGAKPSLLEYIRSGGPSREQGAEKRGAKDAGPANRR